VLDNGNVPQLPSLSEPDTAEMDGFLEEMLLIYPVLGLTVFERPQPDQASDRMLYLKGRGIEARGYEAPEGFVVLSGSLATKDTVPSIGRWFVDQRNSLMERGILIADTDTVKLSQDYTFDSPSAAAGVLLGRNVNGRTEWKDEDGRTLKQIQTSAVEGPES
jgi:hypothetical protein